jgi:hypothetical protein
MVQQNTQLKQYSEEQYIYAELLLTHGFSISAVARIARMSVDTVEKLSAGKVMHEIQMHLHEWNEE